MPGVFATTLFMVANTGSVIVQYLVCENCTGIKSKILCILYIDVMT